LKSVGPFVHNILMVDSPGAGKPLVVQVFFVPASNEYQSSLDVTNVHFVIDQLTAGILQIR
jgi:hypothetical protein